MHVVFVYIYQDSGELYCISTTCAIGNAEEQSLVENRAMWPIKLGSLTTQELRRNA